MAYKQYIVNSHQQAPEQAGTQLQFRGSGTAVALRLLSAH